MRDVAEQRAAEQRAAVEAALKAPIEPVVTLQMVQADPELLAYMQMGDDYLGVIGYTEHGLRHANLSAHISGNVLRRLGYDERTAEVAAIAGFCHDIGNCVSRSNHWISAAFIARAALSRMGMPYYEIATVMNAVGNHEEDASDPATPVAAAVILADKTDVHHTRVRAVEPATFDIHDRVNYAVKRSFLRVNTEERTLTLEIDIDTTETQIMEYFEIFIDRMALCRKAALVLEAKFALVINGVKLL
ncbi:MAG TPA: HD domain-containing protein [Coriobacteriia bacterium]|nr:HD domain-containing protein [Coriobacteriia bacterium]